jgi:hypothetical protein
MGNNKRLITSLLLLLIVNSNIAQVNFEWAKKMGGNDTEQSTDIAIDSIGNIFTVGAFTSDTVDFDPGLGVFNLLNTSPSGVGGDSFIQKLDSNGNFLWVKHLNALDPYSVNASSVSIDSYGNIYVTGMFNGQTDFDPGLGIFNLTATNNKYDGFVLKLNPNGDFLWAKRIDGSDNVIIYSSVIDDFGNIVCTGYFKGTCDFDPSSSVFNLSAAGDFDVFVNKFDSNGNFLWAQRVGGTASDKGLDITTDNTGSIAIIGEFNSNSVDFNPGAPVFNLSNSGLSDVFILKLDIAGNFMWVKKIGGTGVDNGRAITHDIVGNIVISGMFQGNVDFDPGVNSYNLLSLGTRDIFIEKVDSNGDFLWAKQIGGPGAYGGSNSITIDTNDKIYITGNCLGTLDFDPGIGVYNLSSNLSFPNSATQFSVKLSSAGDLVWANNLSTSIQSDGSSIIVNGFGDVYTTGYFVGLTDFNPGNGTYFMNSSNGYSDVFIQKLSQCILSSNLIINSCNSYILNNQTYSQSGIYTQQLTNPQGCDSTITLNLTITQPTSSAINQTSCSSYTLNNQTYTQSGIYTQQITNAQGCDSTITLNLTITQPTSSAISQTSCSSYTLNNQTYTQSGVYTQQLTNALGCDSTIILNLTILPMPSIDLTLTSGVLAANQQNASYQWIDCNNNYNPISGANQNTFSPLVSGNYAVQISLSNCIDTSACTYVQVGASGIIENFLQTDKIYPNPNNGSFIFESALGGFYFVTDLEGRLVYKFQIDKSEKTFLDLDFLSKGVYFITKENESNNSLKLIIH